VVGAKRERADVLLVERGLAASRSRARALIEAGKVRVDGVPLAKPSALVDEAALLEVSELDHPYVSRGGLKLEGALADLSLSVAGRVVADIGASTGGFTDCVLRAGAARVYAIDVGHGQLAPSLRADPRVVSLEHTNARQLGAESLPEPVELVLVDASFIGLGKLLPALVTLLAPGGQLLALVKPQFEVGRAHVGKKGVVRSDAERQRALASVVAEARALGLRFESSADSRLAGPEGNREIFGLFRLES
jgi:23S rRNA (cytidine1920-2'-O)/16S rRNA (cytidine1409-2'-O)-methyltransferase